MKCLTGMNLSLSIKLSLKIGCPKPSAFKSPIKTATYSMLEFLRASLALYFHKMLGVSTCFDHFQPTAGGHAGKKVCRLHPDFWPPWRWRHPRRRVPGFWQAASVAWNVFFLQWFWCWWSWILRILAKISMVSWVMFFMKSLRITSFSWVVFFQDGSYSYNSDLELGQVSVHHRISSQRGRQGGRFSQAACVWDWK